MMKPLFFDRCGFKSVALPLFLIAGITFMPAHAQNKRIATVNFGTNGSDPEGAQDAKQRTLQGHVQDTDGHTIRNAVVFLKDKRDSSIKSVAVDDAGVYHFMQLSQNRDYEVWAQTDKKKGVLKTISAFDDRTDINLNLRIE